MAEETETTEVEKDDSTKFGEKDFVVDDKGKLKRKNMSYDLYQQQQKAQARQAATAGGLALAGEVGQFFVGLSTMNDPTIKAARRDLARLEAKTRESGPLITEAEKMDMRQAAMAPVMRAQESLERKAQNIAAASGDASARTFLKAAKVGLGDVRQQALNVEAKISQEKVRRATARDERIERARGQADSIRAMMLDLRNTYVREPLHKFIGDAAKFTGTVLANQPAPDIRSALKEAKEKGATNEQLNKILSARNARQLDRVMGEILGTGQTADTKMVRGEGSRGRELSDAQKAIQEADDAAKMTRTEPPELDQKEGAEPAGKSILDMTDAEAAEGRVPDPQTGPDRTVVEQLNENLQRDMDAEKKRQERVAARYKEITPVAKDKQEFLYKKSPDDGYAYGYKDGVWTVYQGQFANKPVMKSGTNEPVTFTIEEAKNSRSRGVKELYDLAVQQELIQ